MEGSYLNMTIGFLMLGFAALIGGFLLEGGHFGALIAPTAAVIVFGGTLAAVGVSMPFEVVKRIPKLAQIAFLHKPKDLVKLLIYFKNISTKARKEGLLSIDEEINSNKDMDPFIRKGLGLVVDGVDPDSIRTILEAQIQMTTKRHKEGMHLFEGAGGYAPTMGIIGTVMGLVHVLGNLEDPSTLGPKIAVAFLATLYGVGSANILFLPVGAKLKALDGEEVNEKLLILEALLSIVGGDNPAIMVEKLKVFLDSHQLAEFEKSEGKVEE